MHREEQTKVVLCYSRTAVSSFPGEVVTLLPDVMVTQGSFARESLPGAPHRPTGTEGMSVGHMPMSLGALLALPLDCQEEIRLYAKEMWPLTVRAYPSLNTAEHDSRNSLNMRGSGHAVPVPF